MPANGRFDEVRVITLPPPQTAAVNRLLREEDGWHLLEVKATENKAGVEDAPLVIYVLGHARAETPIA